MFPVYASKGGRNPDQYLLLYRSAGQIAYKYQVPSAVSGRDRKQPLHERPLGLE